MRSRKRRRRRRKKRRKEEDSVSHCRKIFVAVLYVHISQLHTLVHTHTYTHTNTYYYYLTKLNSYHRE